MKAATVLPGGQEKQGMWSNCVSFEDGKYQFLREAEQNFPLFQILKEFII